MPPKEPSATERRLDAMRAETSHTNTKIQEQQGLLGQIGSALSGVMTHIGGQSKTIEDVVNALSSRPTHVQYNNTANVDARSVALQQNYATFDNRSVSMEQKILNLFQGNRPGSSNDPPPRPPKRGGGGTGDDNDDRGPPPPPKRAPLSIADKPKRKEASTPLALEDRAPDEPKKKASKVIVLPKEAPTQIDVARTIAKMLKERQQPFQGKGNRLGDDYDASVTKVRKTIAKNKSIRQPPGRLAIADA